MKLAEAIRQALDAMGVDAKTKDVGEWITANYPKLKFEDASLGSATSSQRKKRKEQAPAAPAAPAQPVPQDDGKFSVQDLKALTQLVQQMGSKEAVKRLLDAL